MSHRPLTRCRFFVLAALCVVGPAWAEGPIVLHDRTRDSGVRFVHNDGSSGRRYIMEAMSAGLALFDYDGDGDEDLYFLNGKPQPPARISGPPPRDALYRNDGGFRFTDVTEIAGLGDTEHGLGVAAADYDNDGDLDLYVNNFGPNVLYRNNGDGTFSDVTAAVGVGNGETLGAGCCFFDKDADGDLDLYVANYVKFSSAAHVPHVLLGLPAYPSPLSHVAEADALYENDGAGAFRDVTAESGIGAFQGRGMGMVCADYDDDGDTDVYVGNDVMENFLFQNDGRGHFEEVALLSGVAYDATGTPQGSMGTDFADYDNDGRLDLLVTSYGKEMVAFYHNLGNGLFEDVARRTGIGAPSLPHVKWGHGFVDFDNDGDRDVYIACGDLDDNVEQRNDATAYALPNLLLMNSGRGTFRDVSREAGEGMEVRASSRGVAFDDLDADGRVDVVVLNSRREPTVLQNASPRENRWIEIELRGVVSSRDGVGARVTVTSGDLVQIDEVHSGRSYQSHFGLRLHFGLGRRERIERIEVRWIGGLSDVIENVAVNQRLAVVEGTARRDH